MNAGLAGLLGAAAMAIVLPFLLLILVGWWVGKRVAFLSLTLRGAAIASVVLGLIPFFFWYPSIGIFIEPGSELFATDFWGHLRAYGNALLIALIPAGLGAAISWVLNIDEYLTRKRPEKLE